MSTILRNSLASSFLLLTADSFVLHGHVWEDLTFLLVIADSILFRLLKFSPCHNYWYNSAKNQSLFIYSSVVFIILVPSWGLIFCYKYSMTQKIWEVKCCIKIPQYTKTRQKKPQARHRQHYSLFTDSKDKNKNQKF